MHREGNSELRWFSMNEIKNKLFNTHKFILENIDKSVVSSGDNQGVFLPYPHISPCVDGLFNLLFYWDTYFIIEGLLSMNKIKIAKENADNLLYLLEHNRCIPGCSCELSIQYGSEPPLLYLIIKSIYDKTKDYEWLKKAIRLLEKEYEFWMNERTLKCGLNHYGHHLQSEIEHLRHYNQDLKGRFNNLPMDILEEEKIKISSEAIAIVESGEDYSSRWEEGCKEVAAVDLNSHLYGIEKYLSDFYSKIDSRKSLKYLKASEKRYELMRKFCFIDGLFFDYNEKSHKRSNMMCSAQFVQFTSGLNKSKEAYIKLLSRLEFSSGVSATERLTAPKFQWDYPNMWAPHQFFAVDAAEKLDLSDARRIATKFLNTVANTFDRTGNLWEKYDCLNGSIASQNEYGLPTMLGWTAGTYEYFYNRYGESNG